MKEEKQTENLTHELPVDSAPAEEIASQEEAARNASAPAEEPSASEALTLKAASETERKKTYRTGSKIAAFVFFTITLVVFVFYQVFSVMFLYTPFANSPENLGEAIGAIFGYIFGFVITIIFGVAQLPENIVSIILFKRLLGKSDKKWQNVLFRVFFILSIVMLAVTILSFVLFVVVISAAH